MKFSAKIFTEIFTYKQFMHDPPIYHGKFFCCSLVDTSISHIGLAIENCSNLVETTAFAGRFLNKQSSGHNTIVTAFTAQMNGMTL